MKKVPFEITDLFVSRRFRVAVAGVLVVCCDSLFGTGTVSPELLQDLILLLTAWIVGDSIRSAYLLTSRRFWAGVAGLLVICSNAVFGEGVIDPEMIQNLTMLLAAWIVGDSLRRT